MKEEYLLIVVSILFTLNIFFIKYFFNKIFSSFEKLDTIQNSTLKKFNNLENRLIILETKQSMKDDR